MGIRKDSIMGANEIKLTITSEDVYRLVKEIKLLEAELNHTQLDLEVARRDFDTYKAAEAEREANIRRQADKELENLVKDCLRRTKILDKISKAMQDEKEGAKE